MQKTLTLLAFVISLTLSVSACKPSESDSGLKGKTSVGSTKIDLTTFKGGSGAAIQAAMKKEMTKNGFNYNTLVTGLGNKSLKGISKGEAVALRLYTSAAYSKINTLLRTKQGAAIAGIANIVKVTSSGLNRLPAKSCTVRRGLDLPTAMVDKILKIKRFEEDAFMSTTSATTIPAAFKKNITFVIKSSKCRDISFLSEYPSEKEILFPPGSEFTVTSSTLKKSGGVYKGTLNLQHVATSSGFKPVTSGAKQNIVPLISGVDAKDYPPAASKKKALKKSTATKSKAKTKLSLTGETSETIDDGNDDIDPMDADWDAEEDEVSTETAVDLSDVHEPIPVEFQALPSDSLNY